MNSLPKLIYIATMVSLLSGCATGYNPEGATGGFTDTENVPAQVLGNGYYAAHFSGNGYTSVEKTEELSLLRCVERAFQDGYDYFIQISNNSNINQTGTVSTGSAVAMPYGGAIAFGSSTPIYAPSGASSIIAFKNKPSTSRIAPKHEVKSIQSYIGEMKKKHMARVRSDIRFETRPETIIIKHLRESVTKQRNFKTNSTGVEVELTDTRQGALEFKPRTRAAIFLGGASFVELPEKAITQNAIKNALISKAVEVGANAVVITNYPLKDDNEYWMELTGVGFYYTPSCKVGITCEPGLIDDQIYKVRSITNKENGLKYGDVIQRIGGIDLLDVQDNVIHKADAITYILKDYDVGDVLDFEVVRNGDLVTLKIQLIANE